MADKKQYITGSSFEDTLLGHKQWLEELQRPFEEQDNTNIQNNKIDDSEHGNDEGDAKIGAFSLSDLSIDPNDVTAIKHALELMIARGFNNPTHLLRWNFKEFVRRQITWRNIKRARRPTLERKAMLFIIDNSPSMSKLRDQARALAAALSASGGAHGADVIVALSFNGLYGADEHSDEVKEDGIWFLNGEPMGELPKPASASGYNKHHLGLSWKWFISKELKRRGLNVHLVGIYGDYDGIREWCFISNEVKDAQCMWFNPKLPNDEVIVKQHNPNFSAIKSYFSRFGYVKGDKRFELFRGDFFAEVGTVQDIAQALKKSIST